MDHHTAALLAAGKHLSDALTSFEAPPADPLITSLWVAMSLLQKAIRRGRHDLAHRAAASLLHDSSERLWRRLACLASGDGGLGDFETVALATAAMAGKRARAEWGGEWKTASYLILRMAKAIKCRAADDLLLAA